MYLKAPKSIPEQIQRLKDHNIYVDDDRFAEKCLKEITYYRLTGYGLQFRKSPQDSDCIPNTTLRNIYNIYLFDEDLRHFLRKYIEIVEVSSRALIANGFSALKCTEPPYDQHYDINNYFDKEHAEKILVSIQQEKDHYKDSLIVKHHNKSYEGKMPLWVMTELLPFSALSKLYHCMYISDKEKIAKNINLGWRILENHLHCLAVLRNKCAHAARLYNTSLSPKVALSPHFLRRHLEVKCDTLFAYIIILLQHLPEKDQRQNCIQDIYNLIDKYKDNIDLELIGFPENYTLILQDNVKGGV